MVISDNEVWGNHTGKGNPEFDGCGNGLGEGNPGCDGCDNVDNIVGSPKININVYFN